MVEKSEDSFCQVKDSYDKFQKKINNICHQNQSTEIMPTEDIFIHLKKEIEKIKKKQYEIKNFRESKQRTNLKYIQIKKDKNLTNYHTLNTLSSNKSENQITKSNSSNNKYLQGKRRDNYYNDVKEIKVKLIGDFNLDNKNDNDNNNDDNNDNINNDIIYNDNDIEFDNNDIINNSSESLTIKYFEDVIDFISLSNINYFQKCECRIKGKDENNCDENTLPIINEKWKNLDNIHDFDFSKIVLKTKGIIDYNTKGIEINIHLKLFEQSSFFIFTRCFVEDFTDINNENSIHEIKKCRTESICSTSRSNKNKIFSKYSTVIKIFKNKNSNKVFVSFGTFYKNKKSGNLHYKTFLQRQLVDYLHQDKNYYYLENDLCEFDIIVIDLGNENLVAKISLNNKEKYNIIKSNFFLPINKKAKLMFCGEGKSAKVMDLKIRSFDKCDEDMEKVGVLLSTEKKSCDCCSIL